MNPPEGKGDGRIQIPNIPGCGGPAHDVEPEYGFRVDLAKLAGQE